MSRRVTALLPLLLLGACDEDSVTLVVRLRSDMSPGAEITTARVRLEADDPFERTTPIGAGDDLVEGVAVAELDVAPGERRVTVTVENASGEVGRRELLVQVRGAQVVTAVITRDCGDVVCPDGPDPDATECFGGRCVPRDCLPEFDETCPAADCADDGDCPAGPVSCAPGVCLAGACGARPDEALCAPVQRCDVARGCVGASDWELSDSFDVCPRVRPWCVAVTNNGLFEIIDPSTGDVCTGPRMEIPPAHPIDALAIEDFALVDETAVMAFSGGGEESWVIAVDMRADAVRVERIDGVIIEGAFDDGAGGLGAQLEADLRRFTDLDALVTQTRAGQRGDAFGMCPSLSGTLQWEVRDGQLFGAWFDAAELEICDTGTGAEATLLLELFDDEISGFEVQPTEIYVHSRQELVVFSRTGRRLRTVPLDSTARSAGLECAF